MSTNNTLRSLYFDHGQSPWLDNLKRGWLTSGELERWIALGVRGITSNPTIFQKAISGSVDYDEQFHGLLGDDHTVEDSYWALVEHDIREALWLLRPVHDESSGVDGFVSVELAPALARDTEGSIAAARLLHNRIDEPNLFVKIPGTAEGVPAIRQMISEGRSINVTLLFAVERYDEVAEAYLSGLEELNRRGGDVSRVHSVASFFVSRVDTEVDRRLERIGTQGALAMRGRAAVANARKAYQLFQERFSGPRWEALAAQGANIQRPLWASTSVKDPSYPDTLYVDSLIGPHTVNTMPEPTLEAFDDHGTLRRTVTEELENDLALLDQLAGLGIDVADVARTLEDEGVAAFAKSFDELLEALTVKADELRR